MTIDYTEFTIEYTDTVGGQAKFSWSTRFKITLPSNISDKLLRIIAKELMGLSGRRGTWEGLGTNFLQFKPFKSCTVLFISGIDYHGKHTTC